MFPYSHEVLYSSVSAPNAVLVIAMRLQQPKISTLKPLQKYIAFSHTAHIDIKTHSSSSLHVSAHIKLKTKNTRLTSSSNGMHGPPLEFLGFNRGNRVSIKAFPPLLMTIRTRRGLTISSTQEKEQ